MAPHGKLQLTCRDGICNHSDSLTDPAKRRGASTVVDREQAASDDLW
jgi:hypothetical protein